MNGRQQLHPLQAQQAAASRGIILQQLAQQSSLTQAAETYCVKTAAASSDDKQMSRLDSSWKMRPLPSSNRDAWRAPRSSLSGREAA